jgi:transposase
MVEYVGLDVSKQETHFCVKDGGGEVLAQGCAATDPQALFDALKEHTLCPQRIVMETGSLSAWLARGLSSLGLPVEGIDAREVHGLLKLQRNKSDASDTSDTSDADLLAGISHCNLGRTVDVGCQTASRQRMLLQARAHLVQQRVALHNTVRGLLNAVGLRFEKGKGAPRQTGTRGDCWR